MHYEPEEFEHVSTEYKSNTPVNIRDLWQTPREIFNKLLDEFGFRVDVAASMENRLCNLFFNESKNALTVNWATSNWWAWRLSGSRVFCQVSELSCSNNV